MLREVLGVFESELDISVIDEMIANGTEESQHLEFKSEFPNNKEFAKDVAAMANGGGGVIVVGIQDENDRAVGKSPVELTGAVSRWQQVVRSNTAPYLPTRFYPVPQSEGSSSGFMFVVVDQTDRIPVAVIDNHRMIYNHRVDRGTQPLPEHLIEQMYRERFRRHSFTEERLTQVRSGIETLTRQSVELRDRSWLYVMVAPRVAQGRVFRPDARSTGGLQQTLDDHRDHFCLPSIALWRSRTLLRFRKVQFGSNHRPDPDGLSQHGWAELHDDGAFLAAIPLLRDTDSGLEFLEPDSVVLDVLDRLITYHLLSAHCGLAGEITVELGVGVSNQVFMQNSFHRMIGARRTFLQESISTRIDVSIADIAPGRQLIKTVKIPLDDIFSGFSYPGCEALTETGDMVGIYFRRAEHDVRRWTSQFDVRVE
jgi:hypothetical protein